MSFFNKEELIIEDSLNKTFKNEFELLELLLQVHQNFLQATSNLIKDTDYPNWTIVLLLSQTIPLMSNAFDLLRKGYLRSSEIMIRVASEGIILSAYFKEFPEAEKEYRSINYRDFYHNHPIEKMLKKIQRDGSIFISDKEGAKKVMWHKIVFENLYAESSKFIHTNSDVIYNISVNRNTINNDRIQMIAGPQLYGNDTISIALRRIFNTILFSIVTFGISLNVAPDINEKNIMEKSQEMIEKLNVKI